MGSYACQGAARPYMAVPPQEAGQADLSLPTIAVGVQVHLLELDCPGQPLHQDVVVAVFPPLPADLDPLSSQPGRPAVEFIT